MTDRVRAAREGGQSVFAVLAHALLEAVNQVPALRQRIRVEEGRDVVVEHPVVHAGLTLASGEGQFTYRTVRWHSASARFVEAVGQAAEEARGSCGLEPHELDGRDDLCFFSCVPWVRFTQVVHPVPIGATDSVPRVSWGRLTPVGERVMCPVNVQAHHALVDGWHLGQFFRGLEAPDPLLG